MPDLHEAQHREAGEALGPRRRAILRGIVVEFIETAEPVGSKQLGSDLGMDVSPATIRNDMAVLEKLGLVYQPHTSAGRVPTDRGFRTFVDQFLEAVDLSQELAQQLQKGTRAAQAEEDARQRSDHLARVLSGLAQDIAFVAQPDRGQATVAGFHSMLAEPEAQRDTNWAAQLFELLEDPSGLLGMLEHAERTAGTQALPVRFLIGGENASGPLDRCSVAITETHDPVSGDRTIMGFIGPTRMDYPGTAALLRALADLLEP